ncbi:D,D-dipeptide ABC transporter permease, partial [Paenibacillus sp. OT2-17]|nr:D,D-dipeptide ABC transporter permease [Paenibacillus sp. OT2-17]
MRETMAAKTIWKERKLRVARQTGRWRLGGVSDGFVYAAGLIIVFVIVCAAFPQWIASYAPTEMLSDHILQGPSA